MILTQIFANSLVLSNNYLSLFNVAKRFEACFEVSLLFVYISKRFEVSLVIDYIWCLFIYND